MTLERVPISVGSGAWGVKGDPGEIGMDGAPRGSVTEAEAIILERKARGRLVLEIGTGTGFSAEHIAKTAERVTTVDIDPFVMENVWPVLRDLGVRCEVDIPTDEMYDVIFIDGNHSTGSVIADYERAIPHLLRPGVVLFHDTHFQCVDDALKVLGLDEEILRYGTALGLGEVRYR